ncbi:hypothetical protein AALP_AA6G044400 [Arabis alpina]|uniref:Knottin scorpion toxin-like domain-containing protein n=1 Tax=Arabis alpina TaxID=50452 RepID=A0A087GM28_ARAAL|nr:hypothetical protein AALP_AA6G044400 [Arabis alpina]
MMKKSFQLSFTVLVIFTILVLGVKGNIEKKSVCAYAGTKPPCVKTDCESTCRQKFKGSIGECPFVGVGGRTCLCCTV